MHRFLINEPGTEYSQTLTLLEKRVTINSLIWSHGKNKKLLRHNLSRTRSGNHNRWPLGDLGDYRLGRF